MRVPALLVVLGLLMWLAAGSAVGQSGGGTPAGGKAPIAYSIELNATIDPATQKWIDKALKEAADKRATIAIIRMDTPGGLDSSMRDMIKHIIAAPMPVVVYVYPQGSRAASAGLYITESADVAAMAPQTNIGSATPINGNGQDIGKTLGRKIRNDAAAYVRALAGAHGRNADLAEKMVRSAVNVPAQEALSQHLIDVVATDQQDLLRKLDGFKVKGPKAQTLHTANLSIVKRDMPFQYDLLELLVNPTVAFLLLTAGFAGIAFELFNPGIVAPGALGAVALVLGLFGTSQLPVNAAGVLLLVVALVLFVLELKITSHGVLGIAGIIALAAGGLLLFNTDNSAFSIDVPVVIFTAALLGGLTLFAVSKALQARHGTVHTGWEELVGKVGEVRVPINPVGQVFVDGALWRARASDDSASFATGEKVRVDSVDGLTLFVSAAPAELESREVEGGEPAWQSS
ncbi:MAG: NfeD family protein [Thermoleophilaceae bacterium]